MKTNKNVLDKLNYSLVYTNDILLSFLSLNKKVFNKFKFSKKTKMKKVFKLTTLQNWNLAIITDSSFEICDTEFGGMIQNRIEDVFY